MDKDSVDSSGDASNIKWREHNASDMTVPRCVICNVRMSKGIKKGPKPLTCSRSACKKKWMDKHIPLNSRSYDTATWYNEVIRRNPDAWDDYFDIE